MSGAIPPTPRMTTMSFWSKPTPMRKQKTKTDHWAKLRLKNNICEDSEMNNLHQDSPGVVSLSWDPATTLESHKQQSYKSSDLYSMEATPQVNRTHLPPLKTVYNQRARDGFRFWLIEKPHPTNFGKYGMGSYKTVLGIGNAPRT
ncbi:hypothetical protein LOTGIDRAFT_204744 [Lottia gigantea]|uniref:Uncharacterized protein n=1 Tax=Lottia gigantea TaxID=225164 RepID=V3ZJI1_LOTGI|nr:hypothetical protein LOTGIDRAFT_204744 [Lottia gigantea]ESO84387.1 hypothetical protein LOTGIDRAFT_204744 [Lottia gigantea]